ncbi:MAG: alpha/beta hydrolase [Acidobacteria bacterium]|nr:alpha/beta hydrolase [Acidobacteriota bacterium]
MFKLLAVAGLSATGLAVGMLSYRTILQHERASTLTITASEGIDEGAFVRLGGTEQWVQIRGENVNNSVLLVLHGGPGMSYVPFTALFKSWEQHFTVVQWERRGVGKTLALNGEEPKGSLSFRRLSADGIELAEYLRGRLHQEKLILLGHSVGSVIGVRMVKERPDLFHAYVGTDQIVDMALNESVSYQMLVERVAARGDAKLQQEVADIGAPPYTDVNRWFNKQRLISATDPVVTGFENKLFRMIATAPGYSMKEMMALGQGLKYSAAALLPEMMTLNLRALGATIELPVVFILAENDVLDPTALAVEYFNAIVAPRKDLAMLKGTGHSAVLINSDEFLRELLMRVRPLASARVR